jgi:PKD repeat protein
VWDFGDGTIATNVGYSTSHAWTTAGVYDVVLTAYNTDNPGGISGNVQLNVLGIAPPLLTAGSRTTNAFQFQFAAQSNLVYVVQRATNLAPPIAWQWVQNCFPTADSVIQVLDSAATNSTQFYRVQTQ